MLELSRRHLRAAIWTALETDDPIRHRWLQEHPHSDSMMNQLVTDATELWITADQQRQNPLSAPSIWTAIDTEVIESTVISTLLETPDLWPELEAQFPRTPTTPTVAGGVESPIPASGPTRRGWHQSG